MRRYIIENLYIFSRCSAAFPVFCWLDLGFWFQGKETDTEVDARTKALKPGQCAVLVYTSGTTGDPKAIANQRWVADLCFPSCRFHVVALVQAVMLSHDNVHYVAVAVFLNTLKQGAASLWLCNLFEWQWASVKWVKCLCSSLWFGPLVHFVMSAKEFHTFLRASSKSASCPICHFHTSLVWLWIFLCGILRNPSNPRYHLVPLWIVLLFNLPRPMALTALTSNHATWLSFFDRIFGATAPGGPWGHLLFRKTLWHESRELER